MTERFIPSKARGIHVANMSSFTGSDPGTKYPVRAWDINAPGVGHDMHEVQAQKTSAQRGPDQSIVGAEKGGLQFNAPLRGAELIGGTMGTSELSRLLPGCGMTESSLSDALATIDAATANTIADAAASGDFSAISVGDMVMVKTSTQDQMRMVIRKVNAATINTLTVYPDFDVTPSNGDDVYATKTYTPLTGEPSSYLGFDVYYGQDATNRALKNLLSCAGKWTLPEVASSQVPMINFDFMVDNYTISEANIAQADETFKTAWPLKGSCMWLSTSAKTKIASMSFDPGLDLGPIPSTCADNGRAGWFYQQSTPVLGITPYQDIDFWTAMEAGTKYEFFFESTIDEHRSWALYCGAVQITEIENAELDDRLLSATPTLQVVDPGSNADGTLLPFFALGITS